MKPALRELDARTAAPTELQIGGDPGRWWHTWEIKAAISGDAPEAVQEVLQDVSPRELERLLSLSEEATQRYQAASEELRVDELDEEFGDLHGPAMDIVRQIADVTPQTPGGLAVSIRALRYAAPEFWGGDCAEWTDEFAGTVIEAAAALAGVAEPVSLHALVSVCPSGGSSSDPRTPSAPVRAGGVFASSCEPHHMAYCAARVGTSDAKHFRPLLRHLSPAWSDPERGFFVLRTTQKREARCVGGTGPRDAAAATLDGGKGGQRHAPLKVASHERPVQSTSKMMLIAARPKWPGGVGRRTIAQGQEVLLIR